MSRPRIAIPTPTSFDPEYNERSWPQYARAVERSGGEPVRIPLDQAPDQTARLIASCSAILLPGSGADVNPQKFNQSPDPAAAPPDPARENVDELLLQDAHNMHKPILTICFGTQMLNVWRGGTLIQDLPTAPVNHKAGRTVAWAHSAEIAPHSLLAETIAESGDAHPSYTPHLDADPTASAGAESSHGEHKATVMNEIQINSSHHQAIGTPGDGLRISARSIEDGVVEAIEGGQGTDADKSFILGVQWHPERTYDSSPASRALFQRLVSEAAHWSPAPPIAASVD